MATLPFQIIAGPADMWFAPYAEPFVAVNTADPTAATNWVYMGMLQGGLKAKHTQTVDFVQADQRTGPVKAYRSAEGLEITGSLLELTMENWAKLMNRATLVKQAEQQVITLSGDSGTLQFKLTYNGVENGTAFVRGTNQTAAAIQVVVRTASGDAGAIVAGTTDAGPFTITFTAGLQGITLFSVTSGTGGLTGTVAETVPAYRQLKMYQGLDAAGFALLVRGPSPYMSAFLQYQVPFVVQAEEPEVSFMRDGNAMLAFKLMAVEDPAAATPADRFGSIVAQTS